MISDKSSRSSRSGSIAGNDLSAQMIRDNLSCLGKHPIAQSHAFLALSAVGEGIRDIGRIESYPNLMYINLSDNLIDSLKPLEFLPALVQIEARNNRLKNCLAFSPKRCTVDNAWPDGQNAVGSMLATADLSGNYINSIGDIQQHKYLECLILASNCITRISGLQGLEYLSVLDLSHNNLTEIDGLQGLLIIELNLEGNKISNLTGLTKCPRLSVLNVANNRISSLAPLTSCLQLHNLNVSGNQIEHIRQVEFLGDFKWLRLLNFSGNPCGTKKHYRARVLYRVPFLEQLDLNPVTVEEMIRANNMYNADGGDLQQRQEVFSKFYPDDNFVDYSLFFKDDEIDLKISGTVV